MKRQSVRDFVFKAILFESEADQFRRAGIKIGADIEKTEDALLMEQLNPFGVMRRNNAIQMARLYAALHCFENEIRSLISETLAEKLGDTWWDSVPNKIKSHAESRKAAATKESWLEGEKDSLFGFLDFGHLADLIIHFWSSFEDFMPSQHWVKQRMDEIEKSRHFIAHNRMLLPSEFQRLYMYISDWNRVIGL